MHCLRKEATCARQGDEAPARMHAAGHLLELDDEGSQVGWRLHALAV